MKIQILRSNANPRNQERRGRSNVLFCFNQITFFFILQEIHQKIKILPGSVEHKIQFWGGFVSYTPVTKLGGGRL